MGCCLGQITYIIDSVWYAVWIVLKVWTKLMGLLMQSAFKVLLLCHIITKLTNQITGCWNDGHQKKQRKNKQQPLRMTTLCKLRVCNLHLIGLIGVWRAPVRCRVEHKCRKLVVTVWKHFWPRHTAFHLSRRCRKKDWSHWRIHQVHKGNPTFTTKNKIITQFLRKFS